MRKARVFAIRKDYEKEMDPEAKWSFENSLIKAAAKAKEISEEDVRLLTAKSYGSPSGLLRAVEDGDYVTIYTITSKDIRITLIEVDSTFRDYMSHGSGRSSYSLIKDYGRTISA